MSTILKALKKAESDSNRRTHRVDEGGGPQPSDSGGDLAVGLGGAGEERSPHARPWRRRGYVISALVLLIGVGIWLGLKPSDSHLKEQTSHTTHIAKKASDPAAFPTETKGKADAGLGSGASASVTQPPVDKSPGRQVDPHPTTGEVASLNIKPKPAASAKRRGPERSSDQDLSRSDSKKNRQPGPVDEESNDMAKAGPADKPVGGGQRKKEGGEKQRWRDAQRLEDDRTVLQAVAWAPRRENRIGMIDGQIVREGDDINGYTVAEIRKQSVILQRTGQYYRLEFKRR